MKRVIEKDEKALEVLNALEEAGYLWFEPKDDLSKEDAENRYWDAVECLFEKLDVEDIDELLKGEHKKGEMMSLFNKEKLESSQAYAANNNELPDHYEPGSCEHCLTPKALTDKGVHVCFECKAEITEETCCEYDGYCYGCWLSLVD